LRNFIINIIKFKKMRKSLFAVMFASSILLIGGCSEDLGAIKEPSFEVGQVTVLGTIVPSITVEPITILGTIIPSITVEPITVLGTILPTSEK
jgi:hypothetical protein